MRLRGLSGERVEPPPTQISEFLKNKVTGDGPQSTEKDVHHSLLIEYGIG